MRDDATYVTYRDEEGTAYIPYWRHELLRAKDRRTVKSLAIAGGALALALIAAIIIR